MEWGKGWVGGEREREGREGGEVERGQRQRQLVSGIRTFLEHHGNEMSLCFSLSDPAGMDKQPLTLPLPPSPSPPFLSHPPTVVFTQLANTNGAIEREGLRMFLHITRQVS